MNDAAAYFSTKLAFETDPSDVAAVLADSAAPFVLIDTRGAVAWAQGHARGSLHIPRSQLAERLPQEFVAGTEFVVYCWGPACNGATRSALAIASLGYAVKEMIGGFEYWAREGLPVDAVINGRVVDATQAADPLVAPVAADALAVGALGRAIAGPACDC